MSLQMMLSIDLKNASSIARSTFEDEMKRRNWVKSPRVTTTWTATFRNGSTPVQAVLIAKDNVRAAATVARIAHYAVVCLPSSDHPIAFDAV